MTTTRDLAGEAIGQAMWEAECDRDFLRQVCKAYIASLSQEEIEDYLCINADY
jgi:hypothetical protein